MNLHTFRGKNAFVTGATGGLGKQICLLLAEYGSNVFMTATSHEKLNILKDEISKNNTNIDVHFAAARLEVPDEVSFVCEKAMKEFDGEIDIVINCAGIFPIKNLQNTTIEDYDLCMNINVRAPFLIVKNLSPSMLSRGWGRIVNVGSSSAYGGSKDTGAYCVSKHALLGLSRSLYQEFKDNNVRVFSFSPGSIKTRMGFTDTRQDHDTFLDPKDVAEYIMFIMSYDSNIIAEEMRVNRVVIR
jgi:3-oxoacyl-[acyl-carrier protein] reductase